MYKTMSFDPDRAFAPVALLGDSPLIIVGSPKMPQRSQGTGRLCAKSNPGKLNAGTVGHGSQAHITLELINKLGGISIVHVPYRIATQALPDLISGRSPGRVQLHPDVRASRAARHHPRSGGDQPEARERSSRR